MEELLQDITLYHIKEVEQTTTTVVNGQKTSQTTKTKVVVRYPLIASFRGTSILNRNTTGVNTTDSILIRIFYKDNNAFEISKDDVIVNQLVNDTITDNTIPLTQLQNTYGKENVFKVRSIDKFKFDDNDLSDINHIKVGLI